MTSVSLPLQSVMSAKISEETIAREILPEEEEEEVTCQRCSRYKDDNGALIRECSILRSALASVDSAKKEKERQAARVVRQVVDGHRRAVEGVRGQLDKQAEQGEWLSKEMDR